MIAPATPGNRYKAQSICLNICDLGQHDLGQRRLMNGQDDRPAGKSYQPSQLTARLPVGQVIYRVLHFHTSHYDGLPAHRRARLTGNTGPASIITDMRYQ